MKLVKTDSDGVNDKGGSSSAVSGVPLCVCSYLYPGHRVPILTGRYNENMRVLVSVCFYILFKKYTVVIIGQKLCHFMVDCGG